MRSLAFHTMILTVFITFTTPLTGQVNNKMSREEKKAVKEKKLRESKARLIQLAKDTTWVIEAFSVSAPGGDRISVSPGTNFVAAIKEDGYVQLAFSDLQGMGINGLGGITMEGNIVEYKLDEGKDLKSFYLTVRIKNTRAGWVLLSIQVQADGRATVNVSGSYGGQFDFYGQYESPSESGAYKGFAP